MSRMSFVTYLKAILLLPLPFAVAGCGTTDRVVASSIPTQDYHARHPIELAEARTAIDLFPSMEAGAQLDRHTAKQVYAFAEQYRTSGSSPILILVPRGPVPYRRAAVAEIKRVLLAGGAHGGIEVSSYPVADPHLASPVRLTYRGIKAQVADQCGQWPSDLASGSSVESWQNKTYWNFGCANQTMIAAQTSDPRDLVTPRGEEATDTVIRSRAIESIRKGQDPNTQWQVRNSSIAQVGAN